MHACLTASTCVSWPQQKMFWMAQRDPEGLHVLSSCGSVKWLTVGWDTSSSWRVCYLVRAASQMSISLVVGERSCPARTVFADVCSNMKYVFPRTSLLWSKCCGYGLLYNVNVIRWAHNKLQTTSQVCSLCIVYFCCFVACCPQSIPIPSSRPNQPSIPLPNYQFPLAETDMRNTCAKMINKELVDAGEQNSTWQQLARPSGGVQFGSTVGTLAPSSRLPVTKVWWFWKWWADTGLQTKSGRSLGGAVPGRTVQFGVG